MCLCPLFGSRFRAVVSWSRVQGVGIPLVTAIEIVSIWILSIVLAIPEAVVFDMVSFSYKNVTMRTCMLKPQTPFMMVRPGDVTFLIQNRHRAFLRDTKVYNKLTGKQILCCMFTLV